MTEEVLLNAYDQWGNLKGKNEKYFNNLESRKRENGIDATRVWIAPAKKNIKDYLSQKDKIIDFIDHHVGIDLFFINEVDLRREIKNLSDISIGEDFPDFAIFDETLMYNYQNFINQTKDRENAVPVIPPAKREQLLSAEVVKIIPLNTLTDEEHKKIKVFCEIVQKWKKEGENCSAALTKREMKKQLNQESKK